MSDFRTGFDAPFTLTTDPLADERTANLRRSCRERKQQQHDRAGWQHQRIFAAASLQANADKSLPIRMGLKTRDILARMPLEIDADELLIGRPATFPPERAHDLEAAETFMRQLPPTPGQTGHCELERTRIFARGIDGLRADLAGLRDESEADTADVYQSFIYALDGLSAMTEHAAGTAERAAVLAPPARARELELIAANCRHIAHQPPATFHQASQLLWLVDLAVMLGNDAGLVVPGHLDRTLLPFYERDVAAGRLTQPEALQLIECLYVLINDFIGDGLAMGVMVGGRDPSGCDVTNDLSYLCLEALRRTRMIYPAVGICWHEGTPLSLVDLAVNLVAAGISTPAFFNDATIQRGLRALDVPPEQSCWYINSTCVEITPAGASNVWVASPYFNLPGTLIEEIEAQAASPTPAPDFAAFFAAYRARLAGRIANAVAEQNDCRELRRANGRKPLQSVFTRDCIATGRDIDDGGATYNWVECSFVGMANLADSLVVVEQEVFAEHKLTLSQLRDVLSDNYAGHEPVRQRFMNRHPKYGNANPAVDRYVREMSVFVRDECRRHKVMPRNSHYVPGTFCWIMHEQLGKDTGATPDGRLAGVCLSDAAGPAQGREKLGPTAAIRSTTSWDHSVMIGGLAYNMKFNASLFREHDSYSRLRDLVLTYLRLGGFETQINVVSRDTLLSARAHPEQYADLVVRIGGYCDYFTRLSPRMQDEIIMRSEFETL